MPTTLRSDENPDEPADDQTTFAAEFHPDQSRVEDYAEDRCECVEEYDLECARCAIADGGPLVGEEGY